MRSLTGVLVALALLASPLTAAAKGTARHADFQNFSYPLADEDFVGSLGRVVKVRGGVFRERHAPTQMGFSYFRVAETLFGDLTGDRQDEAVVTAVYGSNSGTFYRTNVYVFTLKNGRPSLLGVVSERESAKIYRGRYRGEGDNLYEALEGGRGVAGRTLTVKHRADGAHCCSENIVTLAYRWNGSRMKLVRMLKRKATARDENMKAGLDR